MNEQNLTPVQKLEVFYNLTKEVNLKYNEHAILQQYFTELKELLETKVTLNNEELPFIPPHIV